MAHVDVPDRKYPEWRHVCDEGQQQDLGNDNVAEAEDVEYVDVEGINVATWEKKTRLSVVL